MTPEQQMIERLREMCIDWTGEPIVDGSTPRVDISCGELRQAAAALAQLQADLKTALDREAATTKRYDDKLDRLEADRSARDLAIAMAVREACAVTAAWSAMVPPDGGSPTEDECAVADEAATRIRAIDPLAIIKDDDNAG